MARRTHGFVDLLLRAAARVLAPWLQGILNRLEQARRGASDASSEENAGHTIAAGLAAGNEVVVGEAPSGAPAHWVEKVRRGAPHLLRPMGGPGAASEAGRVSRPMEKVVAPAMSKPGLADAAPANTGDEAAQVKREAAHLRSRVQPRSTPQRTQRGEADAPRLLRSSRANVEEGASTAVRPARPPERMARSPALAPALEQPKPSEPVAEPGRDAPASRAGERDVRQVRPRSSVPPRIVWPERQADLRPTSERPFPARPPVQPAPMVAAASQSREMPAPRPVEARVAPSPVTRTVAPETTSTLQPRRMLGQIQERRELRHRNDAPGSSIELPRRPIEAAPTPFAVSQVPPKRVAETAFPSGEGKDRWPALPAAPAPDPAEDALAFWREEERRRYLAEEQEGTYGPRRVSHRG